MDFLDRTYSPKSGNAGFSLIESAVVLLIISLVLGAIWVAAAAVREQNIINTTMVMTQAIRAKAAAQRDMWAMLGDGNFPAPSEAFAGTEGSGWSAFPAGNATYSKGPDGMTMGGLGIESSVGTYFLIRISITGLSSSRCATLVTRLTANTRGQNVIFRMRANGTIINSDVFPVSLTTAISACSLTTNTITIYYQV